MKGVRHTFRWKAADVAARLAYFLLIRIFHLSDKRIAGIIGLVMKIAKRTVKDELLIGDMEYLRDIFREGHIHSKTAKRMVLEARKSQFVSMIRGFLLYT